MKVQRRDRRTGGLGTWRECLAVMVASLLLHASILAVIALIPPDDPPWLEEEKDFSTVFIDVYEEEVPVIKVETPELNQMLELDVEALPPEEAVVEEELLELEEEEPEELADMEELGVFDDSGFLDSVAFQEVGGGLFELGLGGGENTFDGLPSAYQGRSEKQKRKQTKKYGGDLKVLDAVEKALMWLAEHQQPDGSWPFMAPVSKKVEPKKEAPVAEGEEKAEPEKKKKKKKETLSITACALLAFLGAGHTETSGPYRENVHRGIHYINRHLNETEKLNIGKVYGSAIVLMALAESSIFGSSMQTNRNADRLATYLTEVYCGEGWGYSGAGDDFSVSGWVALGLKSARQAELPSVSDEKIMKLFGEYGAWVNTMCNPPNGKGNYRNKKQGSQAMTWVGMFQKQFLGFPREDPFLVKASEVSVPLVPKVFTPAKGLRHLDEYEIYYGTLAAFQQQGEFWKAWNPVMQRVLMDMQHQGDPKSLGGSWDPSSKSVGSHGGRVMTTAIYALCLEVYYRYAMMN